jgi:hypothetical protein
VPCGRVRCGPARRRTGRRKWTEATGRRDADHRAFERLSGRGSCGRGRSGGRRCDGRWGHGRGRRRRMFPRLVHHEHRPFELRGGCSFDVESALRTGGGRFRVFRAAVRTEQGVPPRAGALSPLAMPTDAPLYATRKPARFSSFACVGHPAPSTTLSVLAARSIVEAALRPLKRLTDQANRPCAGASKAGAWRPVRLFWRRERARPAPNPRAVPPDYCLDTATERPLGFARVAKGNIPRASRFVTPVTSFLPPCFAAFKDSPWPSSSPPNGNAR